MIPARRGALGQLGEVREADGAEATDQRHGSVVGTHGHADGLDTGVGTAARLVVGRGHGEDPGQGTDSPGVVVGVVVFHGGGGRPEHDADGLIAQAVGIASADMCLESKGKKFELNNFW